MIDQNLFTKLEYFLKGNTQAIELAIDIIWLSDKIDDLYDQDKPVTREKIKKIFRKLICDIPNNDFYKKFYPQISALMTSAYLMWMNSTELESGSTEDRFICFQIRNSTMNIIHNLIFLVGGGEWIAQVGVEFWKWFAPNKDKLIELLNE